MKLYISHSAGFDYKSELYDVLRKSTLNEDYELILPYEAGIIDNTHDVIKSAGMIIAEVSHPSIGEGIELGWANEAKIPIICIYKKGRKVSPSLKVVSTIFLQYETGEDMIQKVTTALTATKNGL